MGSEIISYRFSSELHCDIKTCNRIGWVGIIAGKNVCLYRSIQSIGRYSLQIFFTVSAVISDGFFFLFFIKFCLKYKTVTGAEIPEIVRKYCAEYTCVYTNQYKV